MVYLEVGFSFALLCLGCYLFQRQVGKPQRSQQSPEQYLSAIANNLPDCDTRSIVRRNETITLPVISAGYGSISLLHTDKLTSAEICTLNAELDRRVIERTEDLQRLNEQLNREIAERKQAEKMLQQSEERLQLAIDAANDVIWDWDIAGKSFFWSERICEFLGLEPSAIPCGIAPLHAPNYKTFYQWVHPLDRARLKQALRNHWKFNHPFKIELRIQKADGSYGWFLSKGKAWIDESGRPARMVGSLSDIAYRKPTGEIYQIIGIAQDITERKQAEEMLRQTRDELEIEVRDRTKKLTTINESLQVEICICAAAEDALWQSLQKLEETSILLQNVLETLPVGVWMADAKGTIWQGNRAAEKIWGGAKYVGLEQYDEYKGWWAETGKRIDASEWGMARAIAKGESTLNEVINIEGFDGTRKTILYSAVPLRNQNAEIVGAIAVNQDITEQRLVEKAFWENQRLIQRIADATPNILYVYDTSAQKHIYVNGAIAEILDYSLEEFQQMGENFWHPIHPDDRPKMAKYNQRLLAAKNGEIVENEYRLKHANGEWRWLHSRDTIFARTEGGLPSQILGAAADITARKQAEIALIESEKRFRIMADTTPVLIWIAGTDSQCTFFNKPWLDFTGRTLEEEIVNAWEVGVHSEDLQRCLDTYRTAFNDRSRFQMEYRLRRADGEYRWLLDTGMPLFSESGDFAGYIGSAIDITERKTAEKALLASEEKFRQLAENINEVFWMTDRDSRRVIYVSPIYEQIWGRKREGLYANPESWLLSIHLEDRDRVSCNLLNNGNREFEIEYRIVLPDGQERWIWDRSFPIRNIAGEIYRRGRVSRDITDRKQTQEALRLSEERLRMAIQSSPILLFNQDLELRYTWVLNPQVEMSVEMMLGKTDAEIFSPENAVRPIEIKRRVLASGIGAREEVEINSNGEVFYYDLTVEPLRDSAGNIVGITCAAVDVCDRKRAEEIRGALEREKALSQLKLRFFSMASHEFRTPLSTILLSAQVLETCNEPGFEKKRLRNIYRIQASAKNMTHLLEDILTITRAETGKLEFNPKPLPLEKFCRQLLEEMHLNSQPQYTINFICGQSCLAESDARWHPMTIACMDEKWLRSILSNLLSNAIKYSPQGGTVNFTLICQAETVIFRIQDEGIGIPQEDQKQLFEAFHRGGNVGSIPGSGLGLTVVKKCVELHGGSISLTSVVGIGTTFTVTIPLGNW